MPKSFAFKDFHIGAHIRHPGGVCRYMKIRKIRVQLAGAADSSAFNAVNIRTGDLSWIKPSAKVIEFWLKTVEK